MTRVLGKNLQQNHHRASLSFNIGHSNSSMKRAATLMPYDGLTNIGGKGKCVSNCTVRSNNLVNENHMKHETDQLD